MTTDTDPVVEDRIRAAFEAMMPVILAGRDADDLLRVADGVELPTGAESIADLLPSSERKPRTPALVAVLASCMLIVGGVVLLTRRVAEVDETPPVAATPHGADVLLLPSGVVTANELDQVPPGRWSAAVQSSDGQVLGINVSEDFWDGALPPDAEVRTIGGRTVGALVEDVTHTYVTLDDCAMVAVSTPLTVPMWDGAVTDLFGGLASNGGTVTVTLPAGWQQLAAGEQREHYNTAFTHTIGGAAREMRLFQSRNGDIAQFLAETYRGTATAITFGSSSAWVVHSNDTSNWNYLIWSTGTTAVMLGGAAATDADLISTAQTLVAVPAPEWIDRIAASLPPTDPGTITPTTVLLPAAAGSVAGCDARTLHIN